MFDALSAPVAVMLTLLPAATVLPRAVSLWLVLLLWLFEPPMLTLTFKPPALSAALAVTVAGEPSAFVPLVGN